MKIVNIKVENIKKIKAVDITPTDNTVIITGKNGQGKSSILDSILYALGGKDALKTTPRPIRDGQDTASVELDLGRYKVVRTFDRDGTTRLEVFSPDGGKFLSPQGLLDELVGSIAFDPLEFANMKADKQKETLLDILGLTQKVEELSARYRAKYDERTLINRDVKMAEGHFTSIRLPDNVPAEPVDTAKVVEELSAVQEHNRQVEEWHTNIKEAQQKVERLEKELEDAKKGLASLKKGTGVTQDTAELETMLRRSTEINNAYQKAQEYHAAGKKVSNLKRIQTELADDMLKLAQEKEQLILAAKVPISGLGINSEGVTYNNIPFSQLSSAEQLKVSLAIAMAMNPELRVMRIMDGSLLDSDNMQVIRSMANAQDYQVWIERVEDDGKVGIVIEDGQVKK